MASAQQGVFKRPVYRNVADIRRSYLVPGLFLGNGEDSPVWRQEQIVRTATMNIAGWLPSQPTTRPDSRVPNRFSIWGLYLPFHRKISRLSSAFGRPRSMRSAMLLDRAIAWTATLRSQGAGTPGGASHNTRPIQFLLKQGLPATVIYLESRQAQSRGN